MRVDGGSPQALRTPTEDTASRSPAVAGETYQVKSGDSLWKLAEQAYGDGSKWGLIRDANPGSVKMRGETPLIQTGAKLQIPPAPEGWVAKKANAERPVAKPAVQPQAEVETAARTEGAKPTVASAFTTAKQSLDNLEFQLKGLQPQQREALLASIESGEEAPKALQPAAQQAVKTIAELRAQLSGLSPEDGGKVEQLLDQAGAWPLSEAVLGAFEREIAEQARLPESANAPRMGKAVGDAINDGQVEITELGNVLVAMAGDVKAAKTPEQIEAATAQAGELMQHLLENGDIAPEDMPMFERVTKQLQDISASGGGAAQIESLGKMLQTAPSRESQAANGAQQPMTPEQAINDFAMRAAQRMGINEATASPEQKLQAVIAGARELIQTSLDPAAIGAAQQLLQRAGVGQQMQQPGVQMLPRLQQAIASTVQDRQMTMREFGNVLRSMSQDLSQAVRANPENAPLAQQQANQLMTYLTQNAKVPPYEQETFMRACQELDRLAQAGAQPRDVERLALALEMGTL